MANPVPEEDLEAKLNHLQEIVSPLGRVLVAFSGGVDSTLVLKVAYDVLRENVLAVTAESPSLPRAELQQTVDLARTIGAPHRLLKTRELENPDYAANPSNRCYYCKSELYDTLATIAEQENYTTILDGTNVSDLGDFRPGQKAARERSVFSPLKEARLTKQDIHALARKLGLPNWDKPASPCLSSRIPYGSQVTERTLNQIEEAESALRALGFRILRVRHHERLARIEVPPEDFPRLLEAREEILQALKRAGYLYVTLDLAGFRSGSLNEALRPSNRDVRLAHG